MVPMTDRLKVWKYVYGLNIKTNNFTIDVTVILDLESTCPNSMGANIGLYGPMTSMIKAEIGLNGPQD